jgi:hypothetical protein
VSEHTSGVRAEPADARSPKDRADEELEAGPLAAEGLLSRRQAKAAAGGGVQRSIARQALRLQASRGNQYVRQLLHGPGRANVAATIHRSERPAAIQRTGGTTVNMTLATPTHETYGLDATDLQDAGTQMDGRGEWGLGGIRGIN